MLEHGKTGEALACYEEAAGLYVDEHKLFYVIGARLLQADNPQQALKYFQRGLEVDEDAQQTFLLAAQAWERLGELDKAEALLKKSFKLHGEDADLFLALAQVYARQGKTREAFAAARKSLQLDPGQVKAKSMLKKLRKKATTEKPQP